MQERHQATRYWPLEHDEANFRFSVWSIAFGSSCSFLFLFRLFWTCSCCCCCESILWFCGNLLLEQLHEKTRNSANTHRLRLHGSSFSWSICFLFEITYLCVWGWGCWRRDMDGEIKHETHFFFPSFPIRSCFRIYSLCIPSSSPPSTATSRFILAFFSSFTCVCLPFHPYPSPTSFPAISRYWLLQSSGCFIRSSFHGSFLFTFSHAFGSFLDEMASCRNSLIVSSSPKSIWFRTLNLERVWMPSVMMMPHSSLLSSFILRIYVCWTCATTISVMLAPHLLLLRCPTFSNLKSLML